MEKLSKQEIYKKLREVDISKHIDKKNGLSYLSWGFALDYMNTNYDFDYKVIMSEETKSPLHSMGNGGVVYTECRIGDIVGNMWLPVLDYANRPIVYQNITSANVNNSIMRCLAKNVAVNFGLGNSLYQGEDIPIDIDEEPKRKYVPKEPVKAVKKEMSKPSGKATKEQINQLYVLCEPETLDKYMAYFKIDKIEDLTMEQAASIISTKQRGK